MPEENNEHISSEGENLHTIEVGSKGRLEYRYKGKLHREDGPAVEYSDGSKAWYLNGKCHREDGPAIEWTDVERLWYKDGHLSTIS